MANTLDALTSSLRQYVVSPLNAFGIGGLVFDAEGDSIANLSCDITDHYTEDNRALQDHIAIRPKRITLRGYVGELVYRPEGNETPFIQTVTQKLTTVASYLPTLSASVSQIKQAVTASTASIIPLTTVSNLYSVVKNALSSVAGTSSQANAYAYFQAVQSQGILMGIQTPWEFLPNMAIENILAIQGEESRFITDFSVTFKQIRIASTQTIAASPTSANPLDSLVQGGYSIQGAAAFQKAAESSIGIIPGLTLPYSALPGAQAGITGPSSLKTIPGLSNLFSVPES
jgi:hypothetical protein